MARQKMSNKKLDAKVFNSTARKIKKKNLSGHISIGGTRL